MTDTQNELALRVTRRFAAPRDRVFDAWTDPEVLRRWWAAGPTWDTPTADVDLRPGGRYRLSMHDPESDAVHTVGGEYTEVRRPERLAYTWAWEEGPSAVSEGGETLVVVEFNEDGDGTEVVLTHSGFGSGEAMGQHQHGWNAVMANLAARVFGESEAV